MEIATLAAGLLLPLIAGVAILLAAPRGLRSLQLPGELAWLVGAGYLVGAFVLTVWMRVLSAAGVAFGWASIAGPIIVATAVLGWLGWRRHGEAFSSALRTGLRRVLAPPDLSLAARIAWWTLLAWIALRFALLGLEVAWRPLYPWDAWIQWATKARVWYELGRIVPFGTAEAWLADGSALYFDAGPGNPPTLSLLQVWSCIALGRWDDALMNWPWWQMAAALALVVYGALRSVGTSALGALVGAFLVASLPFANVHVALAGYADLPLAAYYTTAVLAFLRWCETRSGRDAGLALVMAIACTQIAAPGLAWALTLIPGMLVVLSPRRGAKLVAAGIGISLFVLIALANTHLQIAGRSLHFEFVPPWQTLGQSYFLLANWHLLWYGVLAMALLAWRELVAPPLAPLTATVATALLLLFVLVGFPEARAWLAGPLTPNRATLHLAPLLVALVVLAYRDLSLRQAPGPSSLALDPPRAGE